MPDIENAKIVASDSVAMSEVDGGAALLDLERNVYFSLNRTGAVVWKAIEQPSSLDDVCAAVAANFVVSVEKCRPDVAKLIDKLIGARLARVVDAPAG
ncbi:MAG: PqqD family protein [Hyphomonadaceae bacterium]